MGLGVSLDERVAAALAADVANHVDFSRGHGGGEGLAAGAGDEVDDAGREGGGEGVGREDVSQAADGRELEDDRVAHQQGGHHHRVHLVEGVVEGGDHEADADRAAADLARHAADRRPVLERRRRDGRRARGPQEGDDVPHEVHRPVELLGRVRDVLADLPLQRRDDLVTDLEQLEQILLHRRDPIAQRHRRPLPLPAAVRRVRRVHRFHRLRRRHVRLRPDFGPRSLRPQNRRGDRRDLAGVRLLHAIHERHRPVHHRPLLVRLRRNAHHQARIFLKRSHCRSLESRASAST
mmetsp:Transcript_13347/g.42191  ORF Transcript_13347/g.42191 Transcript_13347/m.42191 type:complete len:293 (-) Transcript_13347:15-893(-)